MSAAAVVAGAIVLVIAVTVLLGRKRRQSEHADDGDSDSRGFIGSILSGLFIVALAFYIVIVWENANTVEDNAAAEAAALADTYWQLGVAPQPQRDHIRTLIRDYAEAVEKDEWPQLRLGGSDPHTGELLFSLHTEIIQLPVTPDQVKSARDQCLTRLREVTDNRRTRIGQAGGLSPTGQLTLVAALVGAAGMVAFPITIGFTARPRHLILIATMTAVLAGTGYVLLDLTQPFDGLLKVEPDAFSAVSEEILRIP
ncbi:bestrophin-like domain [Amycolatopsis sp. H20-H5]|uniref:bestrophin-like domain n=1 Tax=Amycolatopsis sp. H20-H5 TaxID=3046309 RepID=UPI002DBA1906|nr:hypothetical protein [Amycolatopsis sp. H20-H5]MEC3974504.1 hypothetical protein [Amycolatopsis sp. H20-H5]